MARVQDVRQLEGNGEHWFDVSAVKGQWDANGDRLYLTRFDHLVRLADGRYQEITAASAVFLLDAGGVVIPPEVAALFDAGER